MLILVMGGAGVSFIYNNYWVIILVAICLMIFTGVILWYIRRCRRQPRYDYTVLEDETLLSDRLEMDRKLLRDADRNMAMIQCQYYLRDSGWYIYIGQLSDMGSRQGKHWFLVRDTKTKIERLLTMTLIVENCPVRYNYATSTVLLELLLNLRHPYIYPILDIDRRIITEQEFVITVIPFNETGTLKDLIYHSKCQDDWKEKCRFNGCALHPSQIQRLGCQILEALVFLRNQRFPPFVHLHAGNIIVQKGVARISGLENVLLGYTSHHYLLIPKKIYENKEATEIICFGHLLFEMTTGYELQTVHPTEKNYQDIELFPQVAEVLHFIFEQGHHHYPSLKEVASLEYFRHIDLRELQSHAPVPVFRGNLSQEARSLLKEISRYHRRKKRNKRSQSLSTLETVSIDSRDSITSSRGVKKKKKRVLSSSETTPDQLCTPMQTLPLSEIEGSYDVQASMLSNSTLDTTEVRTTTFQPTQLVPLPSNLLHEIQSGYNLRHIDRNLEV